MKKKKKKMNMRDCSDCFPSDDNVDVDDESNNKEERRNNVSLIAISLFVLYLSNFASSMSNH